MGVVESEKSMTKTILWFQDAACCEVADAGGKGASLASMTQQDLPVPGGFSVAADVLEKCVDIEKLRGFAQARDHEGALKLVEELSLIHI